MNCRNEDRERERERFLGSAARQKPSTYIPNYLTFEERKFFLFFFNRIYRRKEGAKEYSSEREGKKKRVSYNHFLREAKESKKKEKAKAKAKSKGKSKSDAKRSSSKGGISGPSVLTFETQHSTTHLRKRRGKKRGKDLRKQSDCSQPYLQCRHTVHRWSTSAPITWLSYLQYPQYLPTHTCSHHV